MKSKNAFLRLFSRSAGKVHVAGEYVSMHTHGGKEVDAAKRQEQENPPESPNIALSK